MAEKNFANYTPGDSIGGLSDGLLVRLGSDLGVYIPESPSPDELQNLVNILGKNKVLRGNEEVTALSQAQMADYVEESGIQLALDRSILDPGLSAAEAGLEGVNVQGAMANWQDRVANMLVGRSDRLPIFAQGGARVMSTPTEVDNPSVAALERLIKRYPREVEYMGLITVPTLVKADYDVVFTEHGTSIGDEMFDELFRENPELLDRRLAVARVANAGLLQAMQLREAGQRVDPMYDSDPSNPQVFAITDKFSVARNDAQNNTPTKFQKPQPALRQAVLTAKKLAAAFPQQ